MIVKSSEGKLLTMEGIVKLMMHRHPESMLPAGRLEISVDQENERLINLDWYITEGSLADSSPAAQASYYVMLHGFHRRKDDENEQH